MFWVGNEINVLNKTFFQRNKIYWHIYDEQVLLYLSSIHCRLNQQRLCEHMERVTIMQLTL